ncbi:hypothetical protein AVEN_183561-1 [Araneus ventricosus]|uniref:Uncharacterized protein n=1 Tax=Araneus ventricosus TaxID=182803 RepID=A0A4Y2FI56_ARAVE|nr:hypothetical protein AVEN_183561-1 [Araneus ventricosus]
MQKFSSFHMEDCFEIKLFQNIRTAPNFCVTLMLIGKANFYSTFCRISSVCSVPVGFGLNAFASFQCLQSAVGLKGGRSLFTKGDFSRSVEGFHFLARLFVKALCYLSEKSTERILSPRADSRNYESLEW